MSNIEIPGGVASLLSPDYDRYTNGGMNEEEKADYCYQVNNSCRLYSSGS